MRVLVCGGRNFDRPTTVYRALDALHKKVGIDVVIEGNARGADRMAGYWARKNRIENRKFPADWDAFGKSAGHIRNAQMLTEGQPDMVVAFPGGPGTANMVKRAEDAGIDVYRPLGGRA